MPGHGRNWRLRPEVAIVSSVDQLAGVVADIHGEFAIFGHSLGAYLGLALAARLEQDSRSPQCATLFVSANAAPECAVLPFSGSPLRISDEEIFEIARRSGGGVGPEYTQNEQFRGRIANLLRADFSLSHTFLEASRNIVTEADIIACHGTRDIFTDSQIEAWAHHTTGGFKIHRFAGGHFYLEDEAEALSKVVAEAVLKATAR